MYFLSYRNILFEYANRSELTLDEYRDILLNIENSPILKISLEVHPIPKFNRLMQKTRDLQRLSVQRNERNQNQTKINVHHQSFAEYRGDMKSRIQQTEFFKRQMEHSSEEYQNQLLQLLQENETYLLSLPNSLKEGPNDEENGILTDFPEYIKFFFQKYAEGATGKEFIFCALKRILLLGSTERNDAEKLLLNTLNDARLAYEINHHYFPGKRYSCMPGLNERLIDMFLPLLPIQKIVKPSTENWFASYYNIATEGFVVGILPITSSEFLQKMFLDAIKSLMKESTKKDHFLDDIILLKSKVCSLYQITPFHLDYLLTLCNDEQLWGINSYINIALENAEHPLHQVNAETFMNEKLSLLTYYQNWSYPENTHLSQKHVIYFHWDEIILEQVTKRINSKIFDFNSQHNQRVPFPCESEMLMKLVYENRFSATVINELVFISIASKYLPLLNALMERPLFNSLYTREKKENTERENSELSKTAIMFASSEFKEGTSLLTNFMLNEFFEKKNPFILYILLKYGDREIILMNENRINSLLLQFSTIEVDDRYKDEERGETILIRAIKNRFIGIIKCLLTRNDINLRHRGYNDSGYFAPPLTHAMELGDLSILSLIFADPRVDLNICIEHDGGKTALILAIEQNNIEMVKLLLKEKRLDVNVTFHAYSSRTNPAIVVAVIKNRYEIMELLLKHPTLDVNAKGDLEKTALIVATSTGNVKMVKLLLTHPSINIHLHQSEERHYNWLANQYFDDWGAYTALETATKKGYKEIIQLLTDFDSKIQLLSDLVISGNFQEFQKIVHENHGKDINYRNKDGFTPLMLAIIHDQWEIFNFLFSHPNIQFNQIQLQTKENELMITIRENREKYFDLLLTYPLLDINYYHVRLDITPLKLAITLRNIYMTQALMNHPKIDLNRKFKGEMNMLMIAGLSGSIEIMELFLRNPTIDFNAIDEKKRTFIEIIFDENQQNNDFIQQLVNDPTIPFESNHNLQKKSKCRDYTNEFFHKLTLIGSSIIDNDLVQFQKLLPNANILTTYCKYPKEIIIIQLAVQYQRDEMISLLTQRHLEIFPLRFHVNSFQIVLAEGSKDILLSRMNFILEIMKKFYPFYQTKEVLFIAVKRNFLPIVEFFITDHHNNQAQQQQEQEANNNQKKNLIDFNEIDDQLGSLLMIACSNNSIEMVQLLLSVINNINFIFKQTTTALSILLHSNYSNILQLLLSTPSLDVNLPPNLENNHPPLWIAMELKNIDFFSLLLHHPRVNINAMNHHKENILHFGIKLLIQMKEDASSYEIIFSMMTLLLKECDDLNINQLNEDDESVLMIACRYELEDIIKLLIEFPSSSSSSSSSSDNRQELQINQQNSAGETALIILISETIPSERSISILQLLLSHPKMNIHLKTNSYETVFMKACQLNKLEYISIFINHPLIKESINSPNIHGETILMMMILQKNLFILQQLLSSFHSILDFNYTNPKQNNMNAMMIACKNGDEEIVKLLLSSSSSSTLINLNHQNDLQETCLMLAVKHHHLPIISLLLEQPSNMIDINLADSSNQTAFMIACHSPSSSSGDNDSIVSLFFHHLHPSHVLDLNRKSNAFGETALMLAIEMKSESIVKKILQQSIYPIDINQVDSNGDTALFLAIQNDCYSIVQLLMSFPGINLDHINKQGQTIFDLSSSSSSSKLKNYLKNYKYTNKLLQYFKDEKHHEDQKNLMKKLELFLQKYPEIELNSIRDHSSSDSDSNSNSSGLTLLMYAVIYQLDEIVKWFLNNSSISPRIDVNLLDDQGESALYKAVNKKYKSIVKMLIKYGGSNLAINELYKNHETVLMIAVKKGSTKVIEQLLKHPNIDLNIPDANGKTVLEIAQEKNQTEIIDLLLSYQLQKIETIEEKK